jgi:HK97 gp10 family phage protein
MPTAEVRGLPELKRELARLSRAVQTRLARNAVMAMARVVAKHARANAPVETGRLRASIKAKRDRDRAAAATTGRVVAFANASVFYAKFIEFGTAHQPPRAFMRPALDEHGPEIHAKLIENLSAGIDRELRKQAVAEDPGE